MCFCVCVGGGGESQLTQPTCVVFPCLRQVQIVQRTHSTTAVLQTENRFVSGGGRFVFGFSLFVVFVFLYIYIYRYPLKDSNTVTTVSTHRMSDRK